MYDETYADINSNSMPPTESKTLAGSLLRLKAN